MVRDIFDNFKCSSFFPFFVCVFAGSLFLASLCLSIYAFARMFTSCCLCAIIRQCTITLSLNRCPPFCFLFVLLNSNCSLSAAHSVYLHFLGHYSQNFKYSLYFLRGSNSFPALNRTFLLSNKRRVSIPTKDNQVSRSEVILFQEPTEK